jgi:hypothetical protein
MHDVGQLRGSGQAPVRDAVRRLGELLLFGGEVRAIVGEQALDVDDPDPRRCVRVGQSLRHHLPPHHVEDAYACRARPEHHDLLLRYWPAGHLRRAV